MRYSQQKQVARPPDLIDLVAGYDPQLSKQLRKNLASGQTLYQACILLVPENKMSIGELKNYAGIIRTGRQTLSDMFHGVDGIERVLSQLQNVEEALDYIEDLSVVQSNYMHLKKNGLVWYKGDFTAYADGMTKLEEFGVEVHGKKGRLLNHFIVKDVLKQYDVIWGISWNAKNEILSIKNPEQQNLGLVYNRTIDVISTHKGYIDASLRDEMMRQRSNALDLKDLLEIIMPAPLSQNSDTPPPKFRRHGYVDEATLKNAYDLSTRFLFAAEKLENHNIEFKYNASEKERLDMIISKMVGIREEIKKKVLAGESRKRIEEGLDERVEQRTNIIYGHLERLESALESARSDVRRYLNLEEIHNKFNMLLEQNTMDGFDLASYESHFNNNGRKVPGSNHAEYIRMYMRKIVDLAQQGMDSIAVKGSRDVYMDTRLQMRKIELGKINKHLEIMKLQEDARDIRKRIEFGVNKYRKGANDPKALMYVLSDLKGQYTSLDNEILRRENSLIGSGTKSKAEINGENSLGSQPFNIILLGARQRGSIGTKNQGLFAKVKGFFRGRKVPSYPLRQAA